MTCVLTFASLSPHCPIIDFTMYPHCLHNVPSSVSPHVPSLSPHYFLTFLSLTPHVLSLSPHCPVTIQTLFRHFHDLHTVPNYLLFVIIVFTITTHCPFTLLFQSSVSSLSPDCPHVVSCLFALLTVRHCLSLTPHDILTVSSLSTHSPITTPHCSHTVPSLSPQCPLIVPLLSPIVSRLSLSVPALSTQSFPCLLSPHCLHYPHSVPLVSSHCPHTVSSLSNHCPLTVL